jgi:hypothetical protein
VVEVDLGIVHLLEHVQQALVQAGAVDGEDGLRRIQSAIAVVDRGQGGSRGWHVTRLILVAYPAVSIVILRRLVQLAVGAPAVDHPATHGGGGAEDMFEEPRLTGMTQGVDPPLGQG